MSDVRDAHRRLVASLATARTTWASTGAGNAPPWEEDTNATSSPLDRAALWVDRSFAAVAEGHPPCARPLRRSIVDLLFVGTNADELWMEVLKGSAFAKHAVRVTRLALLLGETIELRPRHLQELGVAALLHDIGYGARSLVPEQSSPFAAHVTAGLLALAPEDAASEGLVWRGLSVLYHHHPASALADVPSLPARILRLAEDYDRLCHDPKQHCSPTKALTLMAGGKAGDYDPTLLQALFNALGRYPPGTCLQLKDGRICWSTSVARPDLFDRPRAFCDDGDALDLAEEGEVARVIEP